MAGTYSGPVIPVKVLMKWDMIAPVFVVLEDYVAAKHRTLTLFITQKDACEAAREFISNLPQCHLRPRAGRKFYQEIVTVEPIVFLQHLCEEEIEREPDRPALVGIAAEGPASRFGWLIVDRIGPISRKIHHVGMRLVILAERANTIVAQEFLRVKHVFEQTP
jgi:hypothetical protein